MKNSPQLLLVLAALAILALVACLENNPDHLLNPESSAYNVQLATDTNGNGIADGLDPFWAECNGDARCAEQKARAAMQSNPVTVVGGTLLNGETTSIYSAGSIVTLIPDPSTAGLGTCRDSWSSPELPGLSGTDTLTFTMPLQNVNVFQGSHPCADTLTDPRDGKSYPYKILGDQRWLMKNANYRTGLNDFCYANDLSYCAQFGRLYTYAASQSACPAGWRLPTVTEIKAQIYPLNLLAVGRRSTDGEYDYVGQTSKITYWVSGQAGEEDYTKECLTSKGGDCGFIITTEMGGWQIASENKHKAYPVRCVQASQ